MARRAGLSSRSRLPTGSARRPMRRLAASTASMSARTDASTVRPPPDDEPISTAEAPSGVQPPAGACCSEAPVQLLQSDPHQRPRHRPAQLGRRQLAAGPQPHHHHAPGRGVVDRLEQHHLPEALGVEVHEQQPLEATVGPFVEPRLGPRQRQALEVPGDHAVRRVLRGCRAEPAPAVSLGAPPPALSGSAASAVADVWSAPVWSATPPDGRAQWSSGAKEPTRRGGPSAASGAGIDAVVASVTG